jgi:hypothetical protein
MIRPQITELVRLGAFPASENVNHDTIRRQQELLDTVKPPISDEEAKELLRLFGPDDYFGAAWTVLHLVESAPGWPIEECLTASSNEWIVRLRESARRGRPHR